MEAGCLPTLRRPVVIGQQVACSADQLGDVTGPHTGRRRHSARRFGGVQYDDGQAGQHGLDQGQAERRPTSQMQVRPTLDHRLVELEQGRGCPANFTVSTSCPGVLRAAISVDAEGVDRDALEVDEEVGFR